MQVQKNFIVGYAKVSDADTIKISKYKIRLHGIDAPEKNKFVKNQTLLRFFLYIKIILW